MNKAMPWGRPSILVADDDPASRDILRTFLQDEDLSVVLAEDGRQALRKATRGVEAILLDILMPQPDGVSVCRQLKAVPATADIPVLFLSGCGGPEIQNLAREAGGWDFLLKPVRVAELRVRVAAVLGVDPKLPPELRQARYHELVAEGFAAQRTEEAALDDQMDQAVLAQE